MEVFEKPKILIVDDKQANLTALGALLESPNITIFEAISGNEALGLILEHTFALVLLDVQMPEMDGFEATARIRDCEKSSDCHVPIIAMTAHAMSADRTQCIKAGMDDYQSKPFNDKQLFSVIGRLLHGRDINPTPPSPEIIQLVNTDTQHLNPKMLNMFRKMQRPGKPDVLACMINSYLDSAPGLLEAIHNGVAAHDQEATWKAAHTMKSSNGQIGADQLTTICLTLETLGRENALDKKEAQRLVMELDNEFELVVDELRQIASDDSTSNSNKY